MSVEMLQQLIGYDENGTISDEGTYIKRSVRKDYLEETKIIYNEYLNNKLHEKGIVKTEFRDNNFIHEKYRISYPYEWTSNMYKDAVVFHLNLFLILDDIDLLLKDATPNNVLFDGCSPVFIDFLSIIRKNKLYKENWLSSSDNDEEKKEAIVTRMLIPHFIIPIFPFLDRDYSLARTMLSRNACNVLGASAPGWADIYSNVKGMLKLKYYFEKITKYKYRNTKDFHADEIRKLLKLYRNRKISFIQFIEQLKEIIIQLDLTPPKSGYLTYYEDKNEDFDFNDNHNWDKKQISIFNNLNEDKPRTVLDLGANTGWFSILAAKLGAKVISTDIDEASIDSLYRYARDKKLSILPLMLSFNDLNTEYYGNNDISDIYKGRNFSEIPLYSKPIKRLNSECVLCLGLLHHLVLGMGIPFDEVFDVLSKLANRTLLIEFVAINDKLIKNEYGFFSNLDSFTSENYNLSLAVKSASKYFKSYTVFESHPETRTIIKFIK